MAEENIIQKKVKVLRKITPQRLKNIALYYLKRFESSVANLRSVLQRRVNDYAYQNKEFDRGEAYQWIEDILADFQRYGYLNDRRYAEIKIKDYMSAGKSVRYIKGKMREKGIDERIIHATASHGWNLTVDIKPEHEMEKVLYAADELTGLIGACAIMLPSKSVQDLEVKSLKKKFKNKKFAAGCSRDVITSGAELLGWDLDTLFERTLAAMKASGNVD